MDTMTFLIEVPTSCFSHLLLLHIISVFRKSVLKASLRLTNILFFAFGASDTINDVPGLACYSSIQFNNSISSSGLHNSTFNNKWTNGTVEAFFHGKYLSFRSTSYFGYFCSIKKLRIVLGFL